VKKTTVFVNGDFNILHPGHLRLLKFAKESGDYLIVGINGDNLSSKSESEDIRLESIEATNYVDKAFILRKSAIEWIKKYKPDIVIKGKEHETRYNPELKAIESYGGKLLFTSGQIGFSSMNLLKKEFEQALFYNVKHSLPFLKRHNISLQDIKVILNKFSALNVLVIGDTIVDEYITCEPLGMSQEDPTIVVSPLASDKFIGGAAIVASHAKTLGANVSFVSVCGNDIYKTYIQKELEELKINVSLFKDGTRPTTLKQRYRANNKTLLRVNHLKQHAISSDIEEKIINTISKDINKIDLIIFSDFSYGVLTKKVINNLSRVAYDKNILTVADSQSSSQIGDISKFKNSTLVTPTEREIRLALNDFESGLVVLSEKLVELSNNKYIFTTLGAEGVMIYNTNKNELLTDNINALGNIVKDVSGAGDSLLTASSMALAVGASIWESAYLGSLASAIQVSRVGNIPIKKEEILKELD
jgi:rfaE bifunctional protein kinase chain/domain